MKRGQLVFRKASEPFVHRWRWRIKGGHVHVRVFAGKGETLGKCGDLCYRVEEWQELFPALVSAGIIVMEEDYKP